MRIKEAVDSVYGKADYDESYEYNNSKFMPTISKLNKLLDFASKGTSITEMTDDELLKEVNSRDTVDLYTTVNFKFKPTLHAFVDDVLSGDIKLYNSGKKLMLRNVLLLTHYLNLLSVEQTPIKSSTLVSELSIVSRFFILSIDDLIKEMANNIDKLSFVGQLLILRSSILLKMYEIYDSFTE